MSVRQVTETQTLCRNKSLHQLRHDATRQLTNMQNQMFRLACHSVFTAPRGAHICLKRSLWISILPHSFLLPFCSCILFAIVLGAAYQAGILSAASGAEMVDIEQMKKIVPLITCEVFLWSKCLRVDVWRQCIESDF